MREAKYETVEIMVDAELLEQLKPIIEPMGLTPESLAVQFIEWCVAPETQNEAISLLIKWNCWKWVLCFRIRKSFSRSTSGCLKRIS